MAFDKTIKLEMTGTGKTRRTGRDVHKRHSTRMRRAFDKVECRSGIVENGATDEVDFVDDPNDFTDHYLWWWDFQETQYASISEP